MLLPVIVEGLALPRAYEIPDDKRLRLALDLLSAYYREATISSKLVTLCMVLEVLAEITTPTPIIIEHLERWEFEVTARLASLEPTSEDYFALDSLRREVLRKRETSKRQRVRRLVLETLGAKEVELARRAVLAYDSRSTLVHEGALPSQELDQAHQDAQTIVFRVLKTKLQS